MRRQTNAVSARWRVARRLGALAIALGLGNATAGESPSRLSDEPIPMEVENVPDRPRPLLELGDPFLGMGPIGEGITLPTGAVWHPALLVFGTVRSALQTFDPGDDPGARRGTEWVNRIDVFGNLQLSASERIVVGLRPIDKDGKFSGYRFKPDAGDGVINGGNYRLRAAFLEGDLGEIFPNFDPGDNKRLDYGFSVGRQAFIYQDGLLVNDTIDAVGLVRKNVFLPGTVQGRWTALYGWGDLTRGNGANTDDRNAQLFGFVAEFDTVPSVLNFEAFYLDSNDDSSGVALGFSAQQQLGRIASSFHAVYSDFEGADRAIAGDGAILFGEISMEPHGTHNNLYATAFWGIDEFRSIARAAGTGGPLGRAGILFAGVGIGRFGAALGNQADDSVGLTLGYQMFSSDSSRQLILELGGREETSGPETGAYAFAARYQQRLGRRWRLQATGFVGQRMSTGFMNGAGIEILYQL